MLQRRTVDRRGGTNSPVIDRQEVETTQQRLQLGTPEPDVGEVRYPGSSTGGHDRAYRRLRCVGRGIELKRDRDRSRRGSHAIEWHGDRSAACAWAGRRPARREHRDRGRGQRRGGAGDGVWLGGGGVPFSTQTASASIAARTHGSMGRSTVLAFSGNGTGSVGQGAGLETRLVTSLRRRGGRDDEGGDATTTMEHREQATGLA